jgi:NADH-quinone oxidoreductase subunit N
VLGGLLVFFLLAQAGIPLTGGFIAKLEVFQASSDAGEYALVAIGAVATVVAAFAYLRVALAIARPESEESGEEAPAPAAERVPFGWRVDVWTGAVLTATAVMTLWLGVLPATFVDWARHAGQLL